MLIVNAAVVEEMRELVASGDIKLEEERSRFTSYIGRSTQLDDEKLLIAISSVDDDDIDTFAMNVLKVEAGQYEIVAAESNSAVA